MKYKLLLVGLAASLPLVGCSSGDDDSNQVDNSLATLTLAQMDSEALCDAAVPENQREPLQLAEVEPYRDDDGVMSCYYLQVPGESSVNRGYSVSVYPSLAELRGSVNIDAGGTLPRPVAVEDLPGAEQLDLGDVQWSAGITVAATDGRYVHMSSWAPERILTEDDLVRRAQQFSQRVIANLTP